MHNAISHKGSSKTIFCAMQLRCPRRLRGMCKVTEAPHGSSQAACALSPSPSSPLRARAARVMAKGTRNRAWHCNACYFHKTQPCWGDSNREAASRRGGLASVIGLRQHEASISRVRWRWWCRQAKSSGMRACADERIHAPLLSGRPVFRRLTCPAAPQPLTEPVRLPGQAVGGHPCVPWLLVACCPLPALPGVDQAGGMTRSMGASAASHKPPGRGFLVIDFVQTVLPHRGWLRSEIARRRALLSERGRRGPCRLMADHGPWQSGGRPLAVATQRHGGEGWERNWTWGMGMGMARERERDMQMEMGWPVQRIRGYGLTATYSRSCPVYVMQ